MIITWQLPLLGRGFYGTALGWATVWTGGGGGIPPSGGGAGSERTEIGVMTNPALGVNIKIGTSMGGR